MMVQNLKKADLIQIIQYIKKYGKIGLEKKKLSKQNKNLEH
jgi:hypothetical protein